MKFIFTILIFYATTVYSQLKVSDLSTFQIGSDSFSGRKKIAKLFPVKGSLIKSETFSSVYKYEFDSTTFNYCDNASYEFLYVDDKLVNVDVNMLYYYNNEKNEEYKYLKALDNILSSLGESSNLFQFLPKFSNAINQKRIKTKIDDSLNYYYQNMEKFDEEPYLEYNAYVIKNNDRDKKVLMVNTALMKDVNFKRIAFNINLQLTSVKYGNYSDKYSWGSGKHVDEATEIDLSFENGVYKLPVSINGMMTLNFTLDLGASDVSLSPDVFLVLYKAGTISESDFIGTETYRFADGSTAKSSVFNLKTLKIGEIELKNVQASVSNNINSPLLLGQSALKKLSSYKIDNQKNKLIIE